MKHLSIDIETSSLDHETGQILEFAAVYDDGVSPVEELRSFSRVVWHPDGIRGTPYALHMNAGCLEAMAHAEPELKRGRVDYLGVIQARFLTLYFNDFLKECGLEDKQNVVFGKNFGSFDWQFIQRIHPSDCVPLPFDFRFGDVGNLWLTLEDEHIPGLGQCLRRAGLQPTVKHEALDDALQVVRLVRAWQGRWGEKQEPTTKGQKVRHRLERIAQERGMTVSEVMSERSNKRFE